MRLCAEFPHGVRVIDHVRIPLSDGIELCARIWLPTSSDIEAVPAVLEYLPYRKSDGTAWQDSTRHAYFAGHGFASLRVDVRGTGDSDGIIADEYSEAELADGLEVLRWIAAQPWCSGRVGMIGYSWGGINGLQLAAMRPPELAAVITLYSTDDRYNDDCHYKGGIVLGSDMLPWASTMLAYDARPPAPEVVGERWKAMWLDRLDRTPPMSESWLAHQHFDEYWRRGSVCTDYSAIEVPVLAVGGFADPYTNTVGRLVEHLPGFRRGIIGPWGHVFPERGVPGPAIGFLQECVRWWNHWLAEKDSGVEGDPLLRVWMQEWVAPSRTLAERPGRWLALSAWPLAEPRAVFHYDMLQPEDVPVDFACGLQSGAWCPNGLDDQLPDDQAPDDARSLVFDTEPLAERLEFLGRPKVVLAVSFDGPHANLIARLCDVAPDRTSLLVTWQQVRVTGSDVTEVEIELDLGAAAFAPGHRVRLALSGAYWPHAWPSPGAGTMRVHGARLELPLAAGPAVAEAGEPFGSPEAARPLDRLAKEGDHAHKAEVDGDIVRIEAVTRSREMLADGHGHAFERTDRFAIALGDPLSAKVECERRAEIFSEGWSTTVVTRSSLVGVDDGFSLDNSIEAFEGEAQVHSSQRARVIPRDR